MFSRKLQILLLIAVMLVPAVANANNFFDFFRGGGKKTEGENDKGFIGTSPIKSDEEKSECGRQIEVFRKFMHDGKICKQDDDCISMDGQCPLGCKFYINKNFEQIIRTEVRKVDDMCPGSVCAYKCAKINIRPVCVQNRCQARTK